MLFGDVSTHLEECLHSIQKLIEKKSPLDFVKISLAIVMALNQNCS